MIWCSLRSLVSLSRLVVSLLVIMNEVHFWCACFRLLWTLLSFWRRDIDLLVGLACSLTGKIGTLSFKLSIELIHQGFIASLTCIWRLWGFQIIIREFDFCPDLLWPFQSDDGLCYEFGPDFLFFFRDLFLLQSGSPLEHFSEVSDIHLTRN